MVGASMVQQQQQPGQVTSDGEREELRFALTATQVGMISIFMTTA